MLLPVGGLQPLSGGSLCRSTAYVDFASGRPERSIKGCEEIRLGRKCSESGRCLEMGGSLQEKLRQLESEGEPSLGQGLLGFPYGAGTADF